LTRTLASHAIVAEADLREGVAKLAALGRVVRIA
jgi:hypothetical protein